MLGKSFIGKFSQAPVMIQVFSFYLVFMILRMSSPLLSLPFLVFSGIFLLLIFFYFVFNLKNNNLQLKFYIKTYGLVIASFSIYCISFLLYPIVESTIVSDLFNGSVLIFSTFTMFLLVKNRIYFRYFILQLVRFFYLAGILLAGIGIIKYLAFMYGVYFSWVDSIPYPKGTSLVSDYNYYSYFLLLSCLSWVFIVSRKKNISKSLKWYYAIGLIILQLGILGSASRRGFIILMLFNVLLFFFLYKNQKEKSVNRTFVLKSTIFSWIFLFFTFFSFSIIPPSTKVNIVKFLHMDLKNVSESSCKIFYRYNMIYKGSHDYIAYYKNTWGFLPEPDPSLSEAASRAVKFKFAINLFKDAPLHIKLLGNGFSYLKEFGSEFSTPEKKLSSDYPHNFLLSSLLYSGILGTSLLCLLFLQVCWTIYKLKEFKIFMILIFVLSLNFNFFSGNSLFSIPIFGFSLVLPLHAYYLQKIKRI